MIIFGSAINLLVPMWNDNMYCSIHMKIINSDKDKKSLKINFQRVNQQNKHIKIRDIIRIVNFVS